MSETTAGEWLATGRYTGSWAYPARTFERHWSRFDQRPLYGDMLFLPRLEHMSMADTRESFSKWVADRAVSAKSALERNAYYWGTP